MRKVLFLGLLSLGAAVQAQQPPADLAGWRGPKWGMTKAEVLATLTDAKVPDPEVPAAMHLKEPRTMLWIPKFDLPGGCFKVTLIFNDDHLEGIYLVQHRVGDAGVTEREAGSGDVAFSLLSEQLQAKYGPPTVRNASDMNYRLWAFPTTDIEMHLLSAQKLGSAVTLSYAPHKTNDKL